MATSKLSLSDIESCRSMLESLINKQAFCEILPEAHNPTLDVTFGGELAARFCPSFQWHRNGETDQVADAMKAIAANYPDFLSYLYECDRLGQLFAVSIDGLWCADDLDFACYLGDAKSIHVEPLISGSGGNLMKGILGAVLIGVGIAAGATGVLGVPGSALIMAGSSMVLSAVAGALFSRPMIRNDEEEGDKRKSSYFSSSSKNASGAIIPRIYGSSVRELGGVDYAVGRRVPVNVLSFSIKYSEIPEEDDDD